jgi:hypothetical protein
MNIPFVNTALLGNPLNWVIVILMLLIGGMFLSLSAELFSAKTSE